MTGNFVEIRNLRVEATTDAGRRVEIIKGVSLEETKASLRAAGLTDAFMPFPFTVLAVKTAGRLLLIEASDGAYQLTPYDPEFENKMAKAEDIISRYTNTLHALAK